MYDITPGPSKSTTSHYALNDEELLALLQDSDFENENFGFDSEDDDDEYIVEEDTELNLQSPNQSTQNISTSSSSHDLQGHHPE
ncbi:unnamed protein product [Macrosiphum euphorbiae]|uniref:Uncharacterized protein n=1 Tax=Macrosiphum euphorbiae TaxID=13131 RepID=A0AAV0WCE4_9HEMI|nr:unnamed protein product [Macrosiphum euphorbiae]